MVEKIDMPEDVFIVNMRNYDFIKGVSDHLDGISPLSRTLWTFAMNLLYVSPILICSLAFYSGLFDISLSYLATSNIVILMLLFGTMSFVGYRRRLHLQQEGKILIGQILKFERRLTYSFKGIRVSAYVTYSFKSPQGNEIKGGNFVARSIRSMEDGRKFPELGTSIAILYVNDQLHRVL